eukprot:CAMPEP_0171467270 /NCGR_PEP_ID=MMETSP0945-20130129/9847_1 /TAXON_ID=109269 /ORGANISM="Vaucheria litorea, Strain CCMP2940" /LENGTH=95 /DNA_ID=CAMNT_0011995707 /DNA_START=329 /DNA_END=616 /DNA_ORIENTATION=-
MKELKRIKTGPDKMLWGDVISTLREIGMGPEKVLSKKHVLLKKRVLDKSYYDRINDLQEGSSKFIRMDKHLNMKKDIGEGELSKFYAGKYAQGSL